MASTISDIEWMKKQLNDLTAVLERDESTADVIAEARSLYESIQAVENKFFQHTIADGDSKSFRFPNLLYSKLSVLGGDLASSVDFAPNAQQREVYEVLKARMVAYQAEWNELRITEVAAFNRLLSNRNIAGVIAAPDGTS